MKIIKESLEAIDYFSNKFINEVTQLALEEDIKSEKVQEEIIARRIFKDFYERFIEDYKDYNKNKKD